MKIVYILTNHLEGLGGSEIVTLELAQELARQGFDVLVGAPYVDESLAGLFADGDVKLLDLSTPQPTPDLLWIQHQSLPALSKWEAYFSAADQRPRVVYNHMSPFEPLEFPWIHELEDHTADLVLCNSHETLDFIAREYPQLTSRLGVLPNPAPTSSFPHIPPISIQPTSPDFLVVANNIPQELLEAINILRRDYSYNIRIIGHGFDEKRVVSEDLKVKKGIITMGKTVQYAIVSGIPVYNYGHFGGSGWLDSTNFDLAARFNFSGRDSRRKLQAISLAQEIAALPAARRDSIRELFRIKATHFDLTMHLTQIIQKLAALPTKARRLDARIIFQSQQLHQLVHRYAIRYPSNASGTNKHLQQENKRLQQIVNRKSAQFVFSVIDKFAFLLKTRNKAREIPPTR